MSEDNLVNLEDDTPATTAAEPASPPPAAAAPVAAAPPTEPEEVEPDQVDGLLAALRAERAEKKTLKEAAAKASQLEQELAQTRPYVDFLRAHPELTKPQQAPPPPNPSADPKLLKIAKTLDLYRTDGTPDLDRAAELRSIMREDATDVSQAAVQPLQEATHTQRSVANYHQMANLASPGGQKPDPAVLQSLWQSVPARLSADPGVAALLHAAAIGFSKSGPAPIAPPPAPPVVTEASNAPARRPTVSALDQAVANYRNQSAESFAKLASGFQKGRTSALEDE